MSSHHLRTILPAVRPQHRTPEPEPQHKVKKRRVACDVCRVKRTRCNQQAPCDSCVRRGSECRYINESGEMRPTVLKRENIALREKLDAFQRILHLVKDMPPTAAQDSIRRLLMGSDPVATLQSITGGAITTSPSEQDMARTIFPGVHSRLELELLVQHPKAYPPIDPSRDQISTPSRFDRSPQRLNFTFEQDYEQAIVKEPSCRSADPMLEQSSEGLPRYYEARLSKLRIDFWTTVDLSNDVAAEAISAYLENQHPVWGPFDARLFLRDLIELRFDFCSAFMVNALLGVALQSHAFKDQQALNQSFACEKEAEGLFETESERDLLPTLAGIALLHLSLSGHGYRSAAFKYIQEMKKMMSRLKLFDGLGELDLNQTITTNQDILMAHSRTAWGAFAIVVQQTRFFPPSLLSPITFPVVPLPEVVESRIPLNSEKIPEAAKYSEENAVFSAFCRLYIIVNESLLWYHNKSSGTPPIAFALSKFSKLLNLVDKLPDCLAQNDDSTNVRMMFFILLHSIVMEIFRPFVATDQQHSFRFYLPLDASPRTIFAASAKQLKVLTNKYVSAFPPPMWNWWVFGAIIHLASIVTNDQSDPKRHDYCLFYAQTSLTLGNAILAVGEVGLGILAMGCNKGAITSSDALALKASFEKAMAVGERESDPAGFRLDLVDEAADSPAINVSTLVNQLKDMALFNEFIDVRDGAEETDN